MVESMSATLKQMKGEYPVVRIASPSTALSTSGAPVCVHYGRQCMHVNNPWLAKLTLADAKWVR